MFLILLVVSVTSALGMFPPVYHDDTFHELTIDGIPPSDFTAMALVDWDGDYNTDLVGTNTNGTAVVVLRWRTDHFDATTLPYAHPTETIVGIIAFDCARSGETDFLISYRDSGTTPGVTRTRVLRHAGLPEYEISEGNVTSAPATIVNFFGSCGLPDVVAVYGGAYGVHQNVALQTSSCSAASANNVKFSPADTTRFSQTSPPTASPTFTATVDMDGDMGADVVMAHGITTVNGTSLLEYHVYRAPGMLLWDRVPMPLGSGVPSFEDVDADGIVDIAVPVCFPWCQATVFNYTGVVFTHILIMFGTGDFTAPGRAFLPYADGTLVSLLGHGNHTMGYNADAVPPTIAFGDFDSDSYPDMLLLTCGGDIVILNNPGDRTPNWREKYSRGGANVTRVSWMDLGGDGHLDVLFCTSSPSSCQALINGVTIDGLFVQGHVLNGARSGVDYGTSQVGAVQKFWYLDVHQNTRRRIGTQLSSLQYGAMSMPSLYFGLGRTYSYIDEYVVGVVVSGESKQRTWLALIPNSFILVSPRPITSPEDWLLQLFVAPRWLVVVAIGIGVLLFLLAIPICCLKYKEHLEDKEERQKNVESTGMIF